MLRRRSLVGCALVMAAVVRGVHGQAQTILSQDFENGLAGWQLIDPGSIDPAVWHLAPDGECGSTSTMAACNNSPGSCDYQVAGAASTKYLRLHSPVFHLTGSPPWTFSFDYLKDTDLAGDVASLWIEAPSDGIFWNLAGDLADAGSLAHVETSSSFDPDFWPSQGVRLEFELVVDTAGNQGFGWLIDNVTVTNSGGWIDLGEAKAGSAGTPALTGSGVLLPHTSNVIELANARPLALAGLFFGTSLLFDSFKGGTLVPKPLLTMVLTTDAAGHASVPIILPPSLPPGYPLYFQFWIVDDGASQGFAASNAVKGVIP